MVLNNNANDDRLIFKEKVLTCNNLPLSQEVMSLILFFSLSKNSNKQLILIRNRGSRNNFLEFLP